MVRLSIQALLIAALVLGLFAIVSPADAKGFLGIGTTVSDATVRMAGGVGTLLAFVIFSAMSSSSVQPADGPPPVMVDHLVARLKGARPDLAGRLENDEALKTVLQYLSAKRKIAAIKVARVSVGGLKEAKELVEAIAGAVKTEQPRAL